MCYFQRQPFGISRLTLRILPSCFYLIPPITTGLNQWGHCVSQSHRTISLRPLKAICPPPCNAQGHPQLHHMLRSHCLTLGYLHLSGHPLPAPHCLHCVCSTTCAKNQHRLSLGREDGDGKGSVAPESNLWNQNASFQHKNNSTRDLSSQEGRIKGTDFSQMGKLDGICMLTPSSAALGALRRWGGLSAEQGSSVMQRC